jgi:Uma2 family endonuclease
MAAIPLKHDDVHYPESDGEPMAETELHREVMTDLINALKRRYASAPDVYINGNMFFYDVQGDPRSSFSPDVFVVRGIPKERRRIYKIWEEGEVPCFIIEVTSAKTRSEDTGSKKTRYERLGCEEYFLFDPEGDYLDPRLQGYRLENGRYQPLAAHPDGSLFSRTTGLILRVEGQRLRLVDAVTGEELLWDEEIEPRLKEAEKRAAKAEEEIARLRRELEERNRG